MSKPFWVDMPFYKEKLKREKIQKVNGPLIESTWFKLTSDWDELLPDFSISLTDWMEHNETKLESEIWLLTHAPGTKKVNARRWLR